MDIEQLKKDLDELGGLSAVNFAAATSTLTLDDLDEMAGACDEIVKSIKKVMEEEQDE